jgi:hypothetical protein
MKKGYVLVFAQVDDLLEHRGKGNYSAIWRTNLGRKGKLILLL